MKTNAKLALAAIAAAIITTTGAFANDLEFVQISDGHGDHVSFYRPVQQAQPATVGVYARRQGVGAATAAGDLQKPQLRLETIQTSQGGHVSFYRPVE